MKKFLSVIIALSLFVQVALADCPCPPVAKKPAAKHTTTVVKKVAPKQVCPAPAAAAAAANVTVVNVLPPMNPSVVTLVKHDTTVVKKGFGFWKKAGLVVAGAAVGYGIAKLTDNDDNTCAVVVGTPLPAPSPCSKPSNKGGHGKGKKKGHCK